MFARTESDAISAINGQSAVDGKSMFRIERHQNLAACAGVMIEILPVRSAPIPGEIIARITTATRVERLALYAKAIILIRIRPEADVLATAGAEKETALQVFVTGDVQFFAGRRADSDIPIVRDMKEVGGTSGRLYPQFAGNRLDLGVAGIAIGVMKCQVWARATDCEG